MPHYGQHLSDEELVKTYQENRDKELLGLLYTRYSLMCFTVCMKYLKNETLAEDAVMHIFEKLLQTLHQHQIQNFKSWLHSVCRNHCLMELRKPLLFQELVQPEKEIGEEDMENEPYVHQEDNGVLLEEKLQWMEQALIGLNEAQATCIRCFYLEQMSYEQISVKSGFTINEVKSHIQNGKRNLKVALAKKGIFYAGLFLVWIQQSA